MVARASAMTEASFVTEEEELLKDVDGEKKDNKFARYLARATEVAGAALESAVTACTAAVAWLCEKAEELQASTASGTGNSTLERATGGDVEEHGQGQAYVRLAANKTETDGDADDVEKFVASGHGFGTSNAGSMVQRQQVQGYRPPAPAAGMGFSGVMPEAMQGQQQQQQRLQRFVPVN